jgi:predicted molibdopterin-dependent oxidoreductase YjgC
MPWVRAYFANITSLIGGHDASRKEHRAKIASILGFDESVIPQQPALAYDQIVQAIAEGRIKGLWVIATNSSHSWIHQRQFNEIIAKLDFLVVQDLYQTTDTAKRADLVLPAAGWGEKEGTFINSERRIGLVKKVHRAPGQALSDFHIFQLIAHYWGGGDKFKRWTSPEAVFHLLKDISRNQPCDITGVQDYRMLDEQGGVQWPFPESINRSEQNLDQNKKETPFSKERRLFEDGEFFTEDGRARFLFDPPREMPEKPEDEYPFLLLTGRGTSLQWQPTRARKNRTSCGSSTRNSVTWKLR